VRLGESQSFSASYDSTAKIVSGIVIVLFAGIAIATGSILAAGLGAILIVFTYGCSPRSYSIQDRTIVVKRLIGNVRIALDGLCELRPATRDDLRGCIRLWGSGGLFGWYGLFRTSKLGKCTWYVTNRSNAVVAVTGGKTVVFSPDDTAGFMAEVQASVPIPQVAPTDPVLDSLGSYSSSGSFIGKLIGGAFAIVGISPAVLPVFTHPGLRATR
jgi:hypothetical protein